MTAPIWASSMLATAYKLAGKDAHVGRPARCDLRRATSSAYYALFHQVTRHAVFSVIDADEIDVAVTSRWLTHSGVLRASKGALAASRSGAPKREDREAVRLLRGALKTQPPTQLLQLAEAFQSLQLARHEADDNHDYDPIRYVTLEHVETADLALKNSWSMWRAQWSTKHSRLHIHDAYRRFLSLSLLASGPLKTR